MQLFSKQCGNGGFSTARHPNQDDILHLYPQLLMDAGNHTVLDFPACKPFGGFLRLGNQHPQAVLGNQSSGSSIQQELGSGRIVDHIQNPLQLGKTIQSQRRNAGIGVHAYGGGVDNDRSIGMAIQILIIVLPVAGNDHHIGAHFLQNGCGCVGCAAAAQYKHLFPGGIQAGASDHGSEAKIVRIMPNQGAVRTPDDGIDRSHSHGSGRQFSQKRNDIFFIRNGDVDCGKVAVFQKGFQFLRLFFKQLIGVIP